MLQIYDRAYEAGMCDHFLGQIFPSNPPLYGSGAGFPWPMCIFKAIGAKN